MLDQNTRAKIILAADDFGISELSNRNILELLRLKKLDRIAVMMDGLRLPNPEEVRELLASGVKLDIHLNEIQKITKDRALSEPVFPRLLDFLWRFVSGDVRTSIMEIKWRKELNNFHKIFGRSPDGIGAHQHIHFFPAYFKAVLRLAEDFEIPYIRFGAEGLIESDNNVFRILNFLHRRDEKYFAKAKITSSDFWLSLDWVKDVENLADILPEGSTEVVCHPERANELEIVKKYF
jgi:predicted glycoside hydrolase/deacetylase ChbG (UPF0249 family)